MTTESRSVVVRLRAEAGDFVAEFDRAARASDQLSGRVDRSSGSVAKLIRQARNLALGAGLAKLATSAVQLEAAYSKTMAQVAVATEAPAKELEKLDKLALKLGADTVFSAADAGSAMLNLAKGGLSSAQIQAGALADTLTLASAGELDLGEASKAVVNAMGAFQLKATQTDEAVAALAGSANASSAEVSDMTQALAQVGTTANGAGLSIQETTAYLALFANQGFKGSDAGTSLRTMLSRLVPQTDEARNAMADLGLTYLDANDNLVSAEEIAKRTQDAFKGLSDGQRIAAVNSIFGMDAMRGVNAITAEGEKGLRKYITATSDLTQADKLAQAANSGTAGALEGLKGSVETAQIQIGKGLAPVVQDAATKLGTLVSSGDLEGFGRKAGDSVAKLVKELTPLAEELFVVGRDALPIVRDTATATADAMEAVLKVVGPLVEGFNDLPDSAKNAIILGTALALLARRTSGLGTAASGAITNLRAMDAAQRQVALRSAALRGGAGAAGLGLLAYGQSAENAGTKTGVLASALGGAALGFAATGGPWGAAIGGVAGAVVALGQSHKDAARDVSALTATLDEQTGALSKNSKQVIVSSLTKKDGAGGKSITDTAQSVLGVGSAELTDALLSGGPALEKMRAELVKINEDEGMSKLGLEAATLNEALGNVEDDLKSAKGEWKDTNDAIKDSVELSKLSAEQVAAVDEATRGIKDKVITQFTQPGYEKAVDNAVNIARKYDLTPKEVRTILRTLDYSSDDIDKVLTRLKDLDKKTANPKVRVDPGNSFGTLSSLNTSIANLSGTTVANVNVIKRFFDAPGSYTGGLVGPAFAGGGIVPGTPPTNPNRDNVVAYGARTGRPLMVRSGEWIINEPQSKKNHVWLKAMNDGLVLDDLFGAYANGGLASRYGRGDRERTYTTVGGAYSNTQAGGPTTFAMDEQTVSRLAAAQERGAARGVREALRTVPAGQSLREMLAGE